MRFRVDKVHFENLQQGDATSVERMSKELLSWWNIRSLKRP